MDSLGSGALFDDVASLDAFLEQLIPARELLSGASSSCSDPAVVTTYMAAETFACTATTAAQIKHEEGAAPPPAPEPCAASPGAQPLATGRLPPARAARPRRTSLDQSAHAAAAAAPPRCTSMEHHSERKPKKHSSVRQREKLATLEAEVGEKLRLVHSLEVQHRDLEAQAAQLEQAVQARDHELQELRTASRDVSESLADSPDGNGLLGGAAAPAPPLRAPTSFNEVMELLGPAGVPYFGRGLPQLAGLTLEDLRARWSQLSGALAALLPVVEQRLGAVAAQHLGGDIERAEALLVARFHRPGQPPAGVARGDDRPEARLYRLVVSCAMLAVHVSLLDPLSNARLHAPPEAQGEATAVPEGPWRDVACCIRLDPQQQERLVAALQHFRQEEAVYLVERQRLAHALAGGEAWDLAVDGMRRPSALECGAACAEAAAEVGAELALVEELQENFKQEQLAHMQLMREFCQSTLNWLQKARCLATSQPHLPSCLGVAEACAAMQAAESGAGPTAQALAHLAVGPTAAAAASAAGSPAVAGTALPGW